MVNAATETRWPKWSETSAAWPDVLPQRSPPLWRQRHGTCAGAIGALKVYAEQLSDALKSSLHSRSVIDMAKGVLLERLNVDERAAPRYLTDRSRQEGAPLFAVALSVLAAPQNLSANGHELDGH